MSMPPDTTPNQPASARPRDPDGAPLLPIGNPADSDAAWGDQPEPDDDERLTRDRPPHWDSE
jgi:hypothetical protein